MRFPPGMEDVLRALSARKVGKIPPRPSDLVVACFQDKADARLAMTKAAQRGIHGFIFAVPNHALLFASIDGNAVAFACDKLVDHLAEVEAEERAATQ